MVERLKTCSKCNGYGFDKTKVDDRIKSLYYYHHSGEHLENNGFEGQELYFEIMPNKEKKFYKKCYDLAMKEGSEIFIKSYPCKLCKGKSKIQYKKERNEDE